MERTKDARWIVKRLADAFGPVSEPDRTPLETLVLTILSQNTNDTNRDRAYASLLERFGTLDAVAEANVREIAEAVRPAGLHEQKARAIHATLERLRVEHGSLDLGFFEEMTTEEALSWLLSLQGVGPKTAGIVLLFSFGRPYFPIDTHIRRVLSRVGWIRGSEEPHRRVNSILAPDPQLMFDLHLQVIRLGRTLCRPRNPECGRCPIRARCQHGSEGNT